MSVCVYIGVPFNILRFSDLLLMSMCSSLPRDLLSGGQSLLNILELLAGLVSFLTLLPKGKLLSWEVPPFPSSPSHQLLSRDVFRFSLGHYEMEVWGHARAPSVVPGVSWVWYRVCAYPDGDGCKSTLPVRMARRACLPIPKKSLPPHLPFLSPKKKC